MSDSCNVNCISVCTGYQLQDLLPFSLKWLCLKTASYIKLFTMQRGNPYITQNQTILNLYSSEELWANQSHEQ